MGPYLRRIGCVTIIKIERQYCAFFNFQIFVQNAGSVWMELTGPSGAKDFIDAEIELTPSLTKAN
jgi:hypothetical protein